MSPHVERARVTWLVDAALATGPERLDAAWRQWRQRCPDLEGLGPDEHRLLPLVWRRLESADMAGGDADAGRLRGLVRRAWLHNQHLLQQARTAQQRLGAAGIPAELGLRCRQLATNPQIFGCMPVDAADLLVDSHRLNRARRLCKALQQPQRFMPKGSRPGVLAQVPVRLRLLPLPVRRPPASITAGLPSSSRADITDALFAELLDLFQRHPPLLLPPARWLVDLSLAFAPARPGDAGEATAALFDRFIDAGLGPLLQVHARAALQALADAAPTFITQAATLAPRPREQALQRALQAFPPRLAGRLRGDGAWWMARHGIDPRLPAWPATLLLLSTRVVGRLRCGSLALDRRAGVAADTRGVLQSAQAMMARW